MILTLANSTATNDILSWDIPYPIYKIKTIRVASSGAPYLVASYNEDIRQLLLLNTLSDGDADIVYTTPSFTVSFKNGRLPNFFGLSNITELEIELIEVL